MEGSAWLAQRGVEGVGGRALGREPEVAAGWLRTALKCLFKEERTAFEQLWQKLVLEGEQALSRSERKALRGLFVRLEQTIQQPLSDGLKDSLRQEARKKFPIHHRRLLEHAQLFPPGVRKTVEEARDAALRELRSRFPGIE